MPVTEDRFRLSDEEVSPGRLLLADRAWMASLDNLQLGDHSSYWIEMLRALPTIGAQGFKETIAVIDSGFLESERELLNIDQSRSMDFTQEGLGDSFGHGTAIARLIHLVAPRATQVHLKIFNRQRTIAGSSFDHQVEVIRRAFEHLATIKISAVNLSWNHLTHLHDHEPDIRPKSFCHCPICKIITDYVTASDVEVFVSEGNWEFTGMHETRPQGSWSCPASAELIIPVRGLRDGKLTYSNDLDPTCAIAAPSQIGIPERRFKFLGPLSKYFGPGVRVISGSSFAVPLVAATYAAVRSAFKSCRYDGFRLPRSSDGKGDSSSTSYNFPLELFFFPPDAPAERTRGAHAEWYIPAVNWSATGDRLAAEGDYANAGQLLCLGADLLFVVFKRMQDWHFKVPIADQMVGLYLQGIQFLLQSEVAITAPDRIKKARQAIDLGQRRGFDTAEATRILKELDRYAKDHAVNFGLR